MNENEVLRRPFDVETHKKTFINYLEVIILPDGTIEYAVPSHQEKVIAVACKQKGITRQQLNDLCPREYYFDFLNWLLQISGCVSLWNKHMMGQPNEQQWAAIRLLQDAQLYRGEEKP